MKRKKKVEIPSLPPPLTEKEQKRRSMKLYVVFSEVDEDLPHILGIFSSKEKAKKVCDIDNIDIVARAHVQEFELDTVYTIDEDNLKFKINGFSTEVDAEGKCYNAFRRFINLGGPDTMIHEDEEGYIVQTKRLFKASK